MSSVALSYSEIKHRPAIHYLLPAYLLGIIGPALSYFGFILNVKTRWVLFISLILYVYTRKRLLCYLNPLLLMPVLFYICWCTLTVGWSDVPSLSFMKSSLLILTVFTLIYAGILWVSSHPWEKSIDYLWIMMVIFLVAGFLGKTDANSVEMIGNIESYHGGVKNANMFGSIIAMAFPYVLWKLYNSWTIRKRYLPWFFVLGSAFYFLMATFSRASMLAVFVTIFFFLLSLNLSRKIMLLMTTVILIASYAVMNPVAVTGAFDLAHKYVYKSNGSDIFYSRESNWRESLEAAENGGWMGLGFGVCYGQRDFQFNGLTSIGYGREKGNSQLAVVEETGLIGLAFYTVFIFACSVMLLRMFVNAKEPHQRVMVGIVAGIFYGMLVESCFEAWWGFPNSQECCYFWILVGIIRGLDMAINQSRMNYGAP